MKINIIAVSSNRQEHEKVFHKYLEMIINKEEFDVSTYVYCDNSLDKDSFNKAEMLNKCISGMREDYDVLCVFDIDMIYKYQFFKHIQGLVKEGYNYIVSYGFKMSEDQSKELVNNINFQFSCGGEDRFQGCSQITMTKEVVEIFKKCFGQKLYNEQYTGWGGEDSDISYKSKLLDQREIINKIALPDVWFHLWHPTRKPDGYRENNKNSIKFQESKRIIEEIVKNYAK